MNNARHSIVYPMMQLTSLLSLEPIDSERNWELYLEDRPISGEDLAKVVRLSIASATSLWSAVFSADQQQLKHWMLPQQHWARQFSEFGPAWDYYANDVTVADDVTPFLRSQLLWTEDEKVLFVHSQRYALMTTFGVFLQNWRAFIAKNDDPILLSLHRREFVLFGDTGMLACGERPSADA